MKEWKIDNIKIPPVKIQADLNKDTGIVKLSTHVMGIIHEEIAALNSQAIRDSLISMGWTTPETGEKIRPIMDSVRRVAFEIWDSENHSWNDVKDAMAELICAVENLDATDPASD